MRIDASATTPKTAPTSTPPAPVSTSGWTNPAAAAALHSTVEMLADIESGILRNYGDVGRVAGYAVDLRSTVSIFQSAVDAITADGSVENDAFLPLIDTAGGGVQHAQLRLSSKELTSTWPVERTDILAAIRKARSISDNVANQLDPRASFKD